MTASIQSKIDCGLQRLGRFNTVEEETNYSILYAEALYLAVLSAYHLAYHLALV